MKEWWKIAIYPAEYSKGSAATDKTYCLDCGPSEERKWNWERRPYPESSGCRVLYKHLVNDDEPCAKCGKTS